MSDENGTPDWVNPNSVLESDGYWMMFQRSGRGDLIPSMIRQKRDPKKIR